MYNRPISYQNALLSFGRNIKLISREKRVGRKKSFTKSFGGEAGTFFLGGGGGAPPPPLDRTLVSDKLILKLGLVQSILSDRGL